MATDSARRSLNLVTELANIEHGTEKVHARLKELASHAVLS
jgi:hypothetical protein